MTIFRTQLEVDPSLDKIDHQSPVVTLGSCFSQSIGEKIKDSKFKAVINPFGVIFNPLAIANLIDTAICHQQPEPRDIVSYDDRFYSLAAHSDIFAQSKDDCLEKLAAKLSRFEKALGSANWLIITMGTAFGYVYRSTGRMVANCHKQPGSEFERRLLTVEDIVEGFKPLITEKLSHLNIVLTVSPVRHTKDTLVGNSLSKSTLVVAAHRLADCFSNVSYFPAYEALLDDLRDYRFFDTDMIHPNQVAIDYIWQYFTQSYFSTQTQQLCNSWLKLKKMIDHRPNHPHSQSYSRHLSNIEGKLKANRFAEFDLEAEMQWLSAMRQKYFSG